MIKWVDYYERNERSAKLYFDNLKLQKVSQNGTRLSEEYNTDNGLKKVMKVSQNGTLMNKNFNAIL